MIGRPSPGLGGHLPARGPGRWLRPVAYGLVLVAALAWILPHHGVPVQAAMHAALASALASIVLTALNIRGIKAASLLQSSVIIFLVVMACALVGLSLFEGDMNAFYEEGAQYQLSQTGRQFIAGLLTHANEIAAAEGDMIVREVSGR